jgi:hypothetical protein
MTTRFHIKINHNLIGYDATARGFVDRPEVQVAYNEQHNLTNRQS